MGEHHKKINIKISVYQRESQGFRGKNIRILNHSLGFCTLNLLQTLECNHLYFIESINNFLIKLNLLMNFQEDTFWNSRNDWHSFYQICIDANDGIEKVCSKLFFAFSQSIQK